MIVKTRLAEIQEQLAPQIESASLRGTGPASFVFAVNKGRAVEISEDNGGFWLEFWEKSDDEDVGPVNEVSAESSADAVQEAIRWLR